VLADLGFGPPSYGPRIGPYNDCSPDDEEAEWAAWQYIDLTPMPYFASLHPPCNYPVWNPPPPPPEDDDAVPIDEVVRSRCKSTVAMGLYRSYAGTLSQHGKGRAFWDMMRFRPYRRLGVVFWSSCRMFKAGLLREKAPSRAQSFAGDCGEKVKISQHGIWARWLALVRKGLPCRHRVKLDGVTGLESSLFTRPCLFVNIMGHTEVEHYC
jgi:hypothetical protein